MKNSFFSVLDVVFSAVIWLISTPQGVATLVTMLLVLVLVHYVVKERCGICRRRKWKSKMSCERVMSNPKLRCCLTCTSIVGPEAMRIAHDLDRARRPSRLTDISPLAERPVFKAPPLSGAYRPELPSVPLVVIAPRRPPMPDVRVDSPEFVLPRH
jgi:hypothetical protein